MCQLAPIAIRIRSSFAHNGKVVRMVHDRMLAHIITMAMTLARSGIERFSLNLRMYVPIYLWFSNHRCKRVDPFEYKKAARSRNGVVGNRGTKMPVIPNTRARLPRHTNKIFIGLGFIVLFCKFQANGL